MARPSGGVFAIPLQMLQLMEEPPAWRGEKIREVSWKTYGVTPFSDQTTKASGAPPQEAPKRNEDFLE